MSQISLTAPMRSNLLALQNIARQQDIVQNRLATGLKVSSAIDNPSAYYTAASLSNRAADLTALLDAMSQGVQTIKTASEAIDAGIKFLEQAKAVANQALETAVPAKEWFIEQVGENGAVVETAQELLDAVNTGKETIVVYGRIELENQNIDLQDGQKLVGTEYFTGTPLRNRDGSRFSQLITRGTADAYNRITLNNNNLLADLDIQSIVRSNQKAAIHSTGKGNHIRNINLYAVGENIPQFFGIHTSYYTYGREATLNLSGEIIIDTADSSALYVHAIYNQDTTMHIAGDCRLKLSATQYGLINYGTMDIASGAVMNIDAAFGIINGYKSSYDVKLDIASGVKISVAGKYILANRYPQNNNSVHLASGIEFSFCNHADDTVGSWITKKEKIYDTVIDIENENLNNDPDYLKTGDDFQTYFTAEKKQVSSPNDKRYFDILNQYDNLIADSFYKGINLLQGQNLKINFNEDRSAKVEVKGVKADSESLGLTTKEWETAEDIEQSVSELEGAINTLRNYASQYGNYYSIVTTRQDFTENLINVLEEGADKLTLADMNEESANMLALQTSQQLAINSLSLASQAAQSVLKLF